MSTRLCVVPDLEGDLLAALGTLDELFTGLRNWRESDDADLDRDGEPTAWPAPLNDETARDALERLAKALRSTQGTEGPRWMAPRSQHRPGFGGSDGSYEHVPLRFVDLDQGDLDTLAAAGKALGLAAQPGARPVAWLCDALSDVSDGLGSTPTDLVTVLARVHGLLDLLWTEDVEQLHRAAQAAGTDDIQLDEHLDAAYNRTADRINDMWEVGNKIQRWLY